ncbi:MAG: hypothetical protein ACNI3H_13350 [Halarcobacter ebronensis]
MKNHKEFADAHIFTARQAKAVKLVDEVATLSFAQDELIKISSVATPIWKKQDKFDKFIDKVIIQETVTNFSVLICGWFKSLLIKF